MLSQLKKHKPVTILEVVLLIFMAISFISILNISVGYCSSISILKPIHNLSSHLLLVFICIVSVALSFLLLNAVKKTHKKIFTENYEYTIHNLSAELEKSKKSIEYLENLYKYYVNHDRIKTDFFLNMYHELKLPLSVILGAIKLIEKKTLPNISENKELDKNLRIIKQNCYRLLRLINNILDFTKINSGHLSINMKNCNIVYLIEEITQSVVPYAEAKKITLEFDTEVEEIIMGVDVDKIERIFLNLLSNAIKFTGQEGKITVNIHTKNDRIYVFVKDTGPGIPKSMQETIFERFRQLGTSLTRESEGSGIGLSIVKSFVELHDGNVYVNSEVNEGSEFIVEFPIKLYEQTCGENEKTSNDRHKIIEAVNIELSDLYSTFYQSANN